MIHADIILPALNATSKKQLFQTIAEQAAPLLRSEPEGLLTALLDRERIGSTGIGKGVAIPHIKVEKATQMYGVFARLAAPIDYDAIDGEPVDIVFLLVAPTENKTTQHLKMLAYISRFLKNEANAAAIRATDTAEGLAQIISDWAKSQAAA